MECTDCEPHVLFGSHDELMVHRIQNHYYDTVSRYVCKFCNENFSSKETVFIHILGVHLDTRLTSLVKDDKGQEENIETEDLITVTKQELPGLSDGEDNDAYDEEEYELNDDDLDDIAEDPEEPEVNIEELETEITPPKMLPLPKLNPMPNYQAQQHSLLQKKLFPCKPCGKVFQHGNELRHHYMMKHSGKLSNTIPMLVPRPSTSSGMSLPSSPGLSPSNPDLASIVKGNQCGQCGKEFASEAVVRRHIREVHLKIKPYKCIRCPASFGRADMLERHQKVHMRQLI